MPQVEKKSPELRVPRGGIAGWKKLGPMLEILAKKCGLKFSVDGAERLGNIEGGIHLKVGDGGADGDRFNVTHNGTSATIGTGHVNQFMPTGSPVAMTGSGHEEVWIKIEVNLTATNDYVHSFSLTALTYESGAALPTDDGVTGLFYLRVAEFNDGVKVKPQSIRRDVWFFIDDDGTFSSRGRMVAFSIG